MDKQEAICYLQVKPTWKVGGERIKDIRIVNMTQTQPRKPEAGSITLKVRVMVPTSVFMPLRPEVVIDIPEREVIAAVEAYSDAVPVLVPPEFEPEEP